MKQWFSDIRQKAAVDNDSWRMRDSSLQHRKRKSEWSQKSSDYHNSHNLQGRAPEKREFYREKKSSEICTQICVLTLRSIREYAWENGQKLVKEYVKRVKLNSSWSPHRVKYYFCSHHPKYRTVKYGS